MARAFVILISTILILLLIAAGTIWYLLNDEAFLKHQIEDAVSRETGRELSIQGPFTLTVGKTIHISASGLRFADAAWTKRETMMEAGRIAMEVDTRSLFRDELGIEAVSIADCRLTLETAATGERNWDFGPESREEVAVTFGKQDLPMVLSSLDIQNCRLEHLAPERPEPLALQIDMLSLKADESRQYSGEAVGVVDATAFRFSGRFGPPKALWQGGPFSHEFNLQLGDIGLQTSGSVADGRTGEGAELSLSFSGPEFAQVTQYLNLPPFSSGPFDANARMDSTNQTILLSIDGDLGALDINANGEVDRLRQPQHGKISLDAEGPDLRALAKVMGIDGLVKDSFRLQAEASFDGGKVQLQPLKVETPHDRMEVNGTVNSLAELSGSQFEFKASSEELDRWADAWGGRPTGIGPVRIEGKVLTGAAHIGLEDVQVTAGSDRARLKGTVQLKEKLAGSRLEVQLEIANLAATGSLLGFQELPVLPLKVAGPLEIEADRIRTPRLQLESGVNRGKLSADFPTAFPLTEFTLAWEVSGDDLSQFYAVPGFADWPQDFTSSGSWSRTDRTDRLQGLALQLGSINLAVTGNLDNQLDEQQIDLEVGVNLPDASKLGALLEKPFPMEPLEVTAGVKGGWNDLQFANLSASLGAMKVNGDLRLQSDATAEGSAKHRISGNLASEFLDVSLWFEDVLASDESEPAQSESTQESRLVFDDRPVMGFSKSPIDLDLDISVGAADLGTSILNDVRLGLFWTDEELRLDQVSLRGASGADLGGYFSIDGREAVPKLELRFRGKDLMLGLGALENQDPATYPPVELVLDLQGAGKTLHELAVSIDGKIRLFQGAGLFGSARLGLVFNDFISELFTLLNPFAKESEYSHLNCSVLAADVKSGQMTIVPVIIQTREITILSEGTIDLVTERIDMTFNAKARKGVGISAGTLINPFIKVGGRLATPAIELDPKGAVITGGAAVATVGLSLVFKSFADRFFSSKDPCGDARKKLEEIDAAG